MHYLKTICNLLESLSNGNEIEVMEFANEICNLVMDKVGITDYERNTAEEFYEDLNDEITEEEFDR